MYQAAPFVLSLALLSISAVARSPVARADRGARVPEPRGPGPEFPPQGSGRLRNQAQQMCLDATGWNARDSANVRLGGCNDDPDQLWTFTPAGQVVNTASGLCLSPADGRAVRGADLGVDRCERSRDQRWTVFSVSGGAFELRSQRRRLCVDVEGRRGAQGDDVLVWACDRGVDQTWRWEPVARPRIERQPPPPSRPVPGRPPAGRVQPMDPAMFAKLLAAIQQAPFSADQITVIQQASSSSFFVVAQLQAIVGALSFSADQVRAVELVAPKLLDRDNAFQLYEAFTFSGDKEQVKRILERTAPGAGRR
jgi:hypothetical protein